MSVGVGQSAISSGARFMYVAGEVKKKEKKKTTAQKIITYSGDQKQTRYFIAIKS